MGWDLPFSCPRRLLRVEEPVGPGSVCPVTQGLPSASGAALGCAGGNRKGLSCLGPCWGLVWGILGLPAPWGVLGGGCKEGAAGPGSRKNTVSHKTNHCTIFWWCVGVLGAGSGSSGPGHWWVCWCGSPESSSVLEGSQTRFSHPQILLQLMGSHRRWCLAHGHHCRL